MGSPRIKGTIACVAATLLFSLAVSVIGCQVAPIPGERRPAEPAASFHGSGSGTLHVLLTDEPLEEVDAVLVTLSQIEVRFVSSYGFSRPRHEAMFEP